MWPFSKKKPKPLPALKRLYPDSERAEDAALNGRLMAVLQDLTPAQEKKVKNMKIKSKYDDNAINAALLASASHDPAPSSHDSGHHFGGGESGGAGASGSWDSGSSDSGSSDSGGGDSGGGGGD